MDVSLLELGHGVRWEPRWEPLAAPPPGSAGAQAEVASRRMGAPVGRWLGEREVPDRGLRRAWFSGKRSRPNAAALVLPG